MTATSMVVFTQTLNTTILMIIFFRFGHLKQATHREHMFTLLHTYKPLNELNVKQPLPKSIKENDIIFIANSVYCVCVSLYSVVPVYNVYGDIQRRSTTKIVN